MERLRRLREQVRAAKDPAHRRRWSDADIPDPKQQPWRYRYLKLRWRTALAVTTHPVMVALTVAIIVMSIPLYLLVGVSATLRHQQSVARAQQGQIAGLVKRIQVERKNTVNTFCRKINRNIRTTQRQSGYIKLLIIQGAVQSRGFEELLVSHGFPPYEVRLLQAKKQAAKIVSFNNGVIDCAKIAAEITATTPPPPSPATPPPPPK